jgi:ADP-ribose pyrophosphatase
VPRLPAPPTSTLELVAELPEHEPGFLRVRRRELVVLRERERSAPFRYDVVERRAVDAAIIAAHFLDSLGNPFVFLRSALRPPIALRPDGTSNGGVLWELPAGLIEPGESPDAAAARELEEELGFALPQEAMKPLGPVAYPAPAFIAEAHYFFHARVEPNARRAPVGDGSPLEEHASIVMVSLDDALAACAAGEVADAKTELGLRRLREVL